MAEHTTHEALRDAYVTGYEMGREDETWRAESSADEYLALLDGAQAQASPQPAADLRALLAKLPTFSQRVYADLHDHVGRTIQTVELEAVLAALASAPQPAEGRTQPTWGELRSALDAAKHAMADVRPELDLPDQAVAWHRLGLEIAQAERLLLRCPVPTAPEGARP